MKHIGFIERDGIPVPVIAETGEELGSILSFDVESACDSITELRIHCHAHRGDGAHGLSPYSKPSVIDVSTIAGEGRKIVDAT